MAAVGIAPTASRPATPLAQPRDGGLRGVELGERRGGVGHEQRPRLGQPHAPRRTCEQRGADGALERRDLPGDRRGLGRTLTEQPLRRGDRVAATVRRPEALDDLRTDAGDRRWVAALDVIDAEQVRATVDRAFGCGPACHAWRCAGVGAMAFVLVLLGAAVATGVEALEAVVIVLAVGTSRRWRDALLGAGAAVVLCAVLAAVLGPALARIDATALRLVIGSLLLLLGLEWLRKGTLRLAGRRARSSSAAEFREAQDELADDPLPPAGAPDWAGRLVAFKGVLLEGVEVIVIVSALAARPSGPAPAVIGGAVALVVVVAAGAWLRAPLAQIPETELKWGVGVLLTSFGVFFAGEGLRIRWPGGEAALLVVIAATVATSRLQIRRLARTSA